MPYGVAPALLASPWIADEGMAAATTALDEIDRAQRLRARALFDACTLQPRPRGVDGGTAPYRALMQHALHADLLVLGQTDAHDTLTGPLPTDLVAACITDTGKPTLVLPFAGAYEALPRRVLLAWKPTREAARAVTAALPWLRSARQVHVALRPAGDPGAIDHVAALGHWLRLQGVDAPVQAHELGPGDVGSALLSRASDLGAQLLVMGCYGHSRMREWVLGGATSAVLQSMTLPVLMVH